MVRAANEVGLKTRMFGGGLVGPQFAALKTQLGPLLNGVVNYEFYVPELSQQFPVLQTFLAKYQARAAKEGVDPLGFYLPPYAYAMMQVLEQAIAQGRQPRPGKARRLHAQVRVRHLRRQGALRAERRVGAVPRCMMTQYHGIAGNDVDQFKKPGKVTVLYPKEYSTGDGEGALPRKQEVATETDRRATPAGFVLAPWNSRRRCCLNAIIAGLLLGGFYAAVSVGISISFGMLDVVNIAHPAFIILGSYIAYIVNSRYGFDPIVVSLVVSPLFFLLGMVLYRVYYLCFEKRGPGIAARARVLLRHPVHHRGRAGPGLRRRLPHGETALHRHDLAARRGRFSAAPGRAVPGLAGDGGRRAALSHAHVLRPRRARGGAGPARAAPDGRRPGPHQGARVRALHRAPRASRARS